MNQSRFSLNAFILVVACFSAIIFLVALIVPEATDSRIANDFYPIEGTDFAVVYSSKKSDGIYEGYRQTGELKLEGTFGHDWGLVYDEPYLYTNEYTTTRLGLAQCSVVRIDLRTFEKQVLFEDAVLTDRDDSGDLVITVGSLMPSAFPETNSLCRLYAMTDNDIDPGNPDGTVIRFSPTNEAGADS